MHFNKVNLVIIATVITLYTVFDYFLFAKDMGSVIFILFIQLAFILLAISPLGAFILRMIYGSRRIETKQDSDYLYPIFGEVYSEVKKEYPQVNSNINLYMDEDMSINAYASGSNSITVTRGAMEFLSEEQLKGVLAHEFGHIVHGDTLVPLVLLVGNSIFMLIFLFIRFIQLIALGCSLITGDNFVSSLFNIIVNFSTAIILFVIEILLMLNQRANEYQADKYAVTIGYGEQLIEALYILKNVSMGHKQSILERLKSSHPNINARIGRLEQMQV